jgi:hypothetical protein
MSCFAKLAPEGFQDYCNHSVCLSACLSHSSHTTRRCDQQDQDQDQGEFIDHMCRRIPTERDAIQNSDQFQNNLQINANKPVLLFCQGVAHTKHTHTRTYATCIHSRTPSTRTHTRAHKIT